MSLSTQLAKHLREIHFGGNWTTSCLKEHLETLSWQEATTQVFGFNTIATLTYHATYYVAVLAKVLQGAPLNAKDAYSFQLPPIQCQEDWEQILDNVWANAALAASLIEQLPDSKLSEDFTDKKYGTYFRNIQGIIEHLHYHLGQIVLIKKIILQTKINT